MSAAPKLDGTLAALADPTRRRVIDMLRRGPRRAGELATASRVSAPAMSRHLRVLRRRGLIEEERVDEDARIRLYRLRREPFDGLSSWLRELESFWTDQLEAFGAHVAMRQAERNTPRETTEAPRETKEVPRKTKKKQR